MLQIGLVGLGAGAAAALLFASVTSGTWMSVPLFYLAPLPIMIAGLGWSQWSALVAVFVGAIAVGLVTGSMLFLTFLVGVGLPAWWLSHLTLLARPATPASDTAAAAPLEWYPVGRIVIWATFLAAFFVIAVLVVAFGIDADSYRAAMTVTLTAAMREFIAANPDFTGVSAERLVAFLVTSTPPTAAVVTAMTSLVNLWLASRIVTLSGMMKRPWPDLSAIVFPKMMLAVLAIAVALNVVGGTLGVIALVLSSTLMLAFAILGLAVLHAVTRGFSGRPFVLSGVYFSIPLLQGLPMLVFCLLGISETAFDLRARAARKRGPPARL